MAKNMRQALETVALLTSLAKEHRLALVVAAKVFAANSAFVTENILAIFAAYSITSMTFMNIFANTKRLAQRTARSAKFGLDAIFAFQLEVATIIFLRGLVVVDLVLGCFIVKDRNLGSVRGTIILIQVRVLANLRRCLQKLDHLFATEKGKNIP